MTILNGNKPATRTATTNGLCLVASVIKSRKMEMRALGYLYAMYKNPGETVATKGFGFKPNCVLPIDNGFEFDPKELLVFDEHLNSSRVRDEFYPKVPEVPPVAAARLQEDGIHPDTDRIQDIPGSPSPAVPAPLLPTLRMTTEQLMEFLTPEDQEDLKRQLAYTILAAQSMGVTQAAAWQQATSLAGVHFIPAFDPRYKESLR